MAVLLQLKGITKYYGATMILEDATAAFSEYQKIGVIGRNGAGKSTLCKIITGHEEMDSGTITRNSALRLSYLEQHDPYKLDETVMGFLARYTGKEEWECGEIAGRFQLKNEILDMKISELAGGFRTRVKLTAMLLGDPNFLILDEPTNYLDLSTLILLENFLLDFNGGFLIVSHDREFLKRTCDHTLEIEHGRTTLYPDGIEEYFEFKEEQLRQKMAYNKTIEKKKEQLQEFVDRFKAKASTATRAKSKMKQIEKLKTIEIAHPLSSVVIKIPPVENKTGIALFCEDLSIGYPDKMVATNITMEVNRGQRVAVLGDNGQGKTTFLRTLAGDLQPKGGSFRWGTGLKVGYYAQHVFSSLNPQDTIMSYLQRDAAPGVNTQDVLNMAGAFLFQGTEVQKKVGVLSGGERARLVLASLLLMKCQVLMLDEPTNHLDFETVEALAKALEGFGGTLFFISHDRTFVNLVANQIIEVKRGRVSRYPGVYEDYVYHLECQARELTEEAHAHHAGPHPSTHGHASGDAGKKEEVEAQEKKARQEEITKLQDQIKKAENRIKHLTQEKEKLVEESNKNPFNFSKDRAKRLKELTVDLEKEEDAWMNLQSKLEKLK